MKTPLKTLLFLSVITFSAWAGATKATAQSHSSGHHHCSNHRDFNRCYQAGFHGYRIPVYGYGYRPYGYDHRYGTAELLRSAAIAGVNHSRARAINAQTARAEMENRVQYLLTRLERKRINHESRFGHLEERKERVRLEKAKEAMLASHAEPETVVDRRSGVVRWPLLLRTSHYVNARRPVDIVFEQRRERGRINPDHFLPLCDWIEKIQAELKSKMAQYEMQDYMEAQDFLRGLIDEARIDLDSMPHGVPMDQFVSAN